MIDWPKVVRDLEKENAELKKQIEQHEWVGLTDDETMHLLNDTAGQWWADESHIQRFRKEIEAQIKEKNHIANVGKMIGGDDANRVE